MIAAKQIEAIAARAPLAKGYRFELLERKEIAAVIGLIATWFPDIRVGGASGYLREAFYAEQVYFDDACSRNVIVQLLKQGDELAGVFTCEFDRDRLSVYGGIGVVTPRHRGANLAQAGIWFTETIGRRLGMGLAYGMATLKAPHAQRAFERAGWRLVGMTPGYDRELVAPGVVKRVYEAVYAKVLVADADLLHPERRNMTPDTRDFFERVFPDPPLAQPQPRELHDAQAG